MLHNIGITLHNILVGDVDRHQQGVRYSLLDVGLYHVFQEPVLWVENLASPTPGCLDEELDIRLVLQNSLDKFAEHGSVDFGEFGAFPLDVESSRSLKQVRNQKDIAHVFSSPDEGGLAVPHDEKVADNQEVEVTFVGGQQDDGSIPVVMVSDALNKLVVEVNPLVHLPEDVVHREHQG